MKFAIAGMLGVALAGGAGAQSPPIIEQEAARARQLLQSTAWAGKAWGAYFAGRLHSDELREPLIEEFRAAAGLAYSPPNTAEYAFVASLFDAAIESDIGVPAEVLQPFEETWSDPVLILLARHDNEDLLLRLADNRRRDTIWLAANNLLYGRKSQRWYATTLTELSITHRFSATDPGTGWGGLSGSGGGECGDGIAAMPKGFPPITFYRLDATATMGSVLLAKGPQNVYYSRRIVPADKQVGFGSCGSPIDRMAARIGYLAEIAGLSAPQALNLFHAETSIPYRSLDDFQRQAEQSLQAQEQGIREMLRKAKERGFDPDGVTLQIVPQLNDMRQSAAGPLPTLTPREIVLE